MPPMQTNSLKRNRPTKDSPATSSAPSRATKAGNHPPLAPSRWAGTGRKIAPLNMTTSHPDRLPPGIILDGELMTDETLFLFDAPRVDLNGKALVDFGWPYNERLHVLCELVRLVWRGNARIKVAPYATSTEHKLRQAKALLEAHAEGIVARKVDGKDVSGSARRTSRRSGSPRRPTASSSGSRTVARATSCWRFTTTKASPWRWGRSRAGPATAGSSG